MGKYIQLPNGKLAGSIGDGKDSVPEPQPEGTRTVPVAEANDTAGRPLPGQAYSKFRQQILKRYEGLTLSVTEPPAWAVEAHRDQLREAGIRVVVVDTETTGIPVHTGSVTEVAWYDVTDGVGGSFIPPHDVSQAHPKALEVSRYDERIAGKPVDEQQVAELHRILGGDGSKVIIAGSNPGFDRDHLNALFEKVGLPTEPWQRRLIDVAQAAYWVSDRQTGNPVGLADAAALHDVSIEGHHDAMVDVFCTAELWHVLETKRQAAFCS